MADARRFSLTPQLDIQQILIEAKSRWLRPSEICEILRNHQRFSLTPDPPYQPSGGSLFLFDRKALRYFRKDGHSWRKKKDGKTVREAHEKLKSGSVDVLHCYYAHGEDNENFQRRSYWMLDGQLEHIVLVHYRDVTEGCRSSTSHFSNTDPEITGSAQATPSSEFEDADSGDDFGGASITDSMSCSRFEIASLHGNDMVGTKVEGSSSYFSCPDTSGLTDTASMDRSSNPFFANLVPSQNLISSGDQQNICGSSQLSGSFGATRFTQPITPATWQKDICLNRTSTECQAQNISSEQPRRTSDPLPDDHGVLNRGLDDGSTILVDTYPQSFRRDGNAQFLMKEEYSKDVQSPFSENATGHNLSGSYEVLNKTRFCTTPELRYNTGALKKVPSRSQHLECATEFPYAVKSEMRSDAHIPELGELKKLDSFGRWMDKEIGKDCDDSLMTSDPGSCWNSLNTPNVDKEVSCLSRQMQLDGDSLGPSLSGEQLFSILDFSPDWAYSGIGTKVLITGNFLGGIEPNTIKWCCMFGEQEVSAEVLTKNVIRCESPMHPPGRVPFYITRSNRLACSEVREFEYREKQSDETFPSSRKIEPEEEVQLQVRFAKMLSLRSDTKKLTCTVENCPKCMLKKGFFSLLTDDAHEWDNIEKDSKAFQGYHINHRNILLEKMLKGMLYHWLAYKVHEEDKGPRTFDEEGQSAIHLAAALGYQWAVNPIVSAGVHPSFRDAHGRTALHWAAHFGREETVVALLRLGTSPGAVEDPTSTFPGGKTAADLASNRGHKGIAGYLAEAALNSHLSVLTLGDSMLGSASATADEVVETVKEQNDFSLDGENGDQLSLRDSLAAVRNAALAAAQIQLAFRSYSFRQRQLRDGICGNSDIDNTAMAISSLSNKAHTTNHFSDSLHVSAVKIQQKYRGWKGHRDFVKIRDRIVKIQAHARGHQVGKQYKKVVWSVSIVEKAILRWRRKRTGLRGFSSQKSGASEQEVGEKDEYEFVRLGREQKASAVEKALGIVQSMVRSPAARDQYMRLVAMSHKPQLAEKDKSKT